MNENQLVGVPQSVLADTRVQEALNTANSGLDIPATAALAGQTISGLEKYGLSPRKPGLMHQTQMVAILSSFPQHNGEPDVPTAYQPWIWIWSLCAPIRDVFDAPTLIKNNGASALMEKIAQWVDDAKIPDSASNDFLEAMTETISLTSKLMMANEKGEGNGTEIKKA